MQFHLKSFSIGSQRMKQLPSDSNTRKCLRGIWSKVSHGCLRAGQHWPPKMLCFPLDAPKHCFTDQSPPVLPVPSLHPTLRLWDHYSVEFTWTRVPCCHDSSKGLTGRYAQCRQARQRDKRVQDFLLLLRVTDKLVCLEFSIYYLEC